MRWALSILVATLRFTRHVFSTTIVIMLSSVEELNRVELASAAGSNFGWDVTEGATGPCFNETSCDLALVQLACAWQWLS